MNWHSLHLLNLSLKWVFHMLDRLKPTAMGLDGLPEWFLRVSGPVFAAPLAALLNQSFAEGVVPWQWKTALIVPVSKVVVHVGF